MTMRNWSTDEKNLSKYPDKYKKWKLEQLINFGIGDQKISAKSLKKSLPRLNIDPKKKNFLSFLLS
jgi:hypothetical protein